MRLMVELLGIDSDTDNEQDAEDQVEDGNDDISVSSGVNNTNPAATGGNYSR